MSGRNPAGETVASFVQVSRGMSFTYDSARLQGSKLISLNIGPADPVPPVDLEKTYTLTTLDYIAAGGQSLCACDTMHANEPIVLR